MKHGTIWTTTTTTSREFSIDRSWCVVVFRWNLKFFSLLHQSSISLSLSFLSLSFIFPWTLAEFSSSRSPPHNFKVLVGVDVSRLSVVSNAVNSPSMQPKNQLIRPLEDWKFENSSVVWMWNNVRCGAVKVQYFLKM